ncbi:MAG: hypothetical protein FWH12_02435 [Treponema sp.]|nr:hypothetical protein [Treponema sp.]
MKERNLEVLIEEKIKARLTGINAFGQDEVSFVGYNPIEKIRGAMYCWVMVPFEGVDVWCQLRCPNATQIEQCGDISSIAAEQVNETVKYSYDDIIKVRNYQENICKIVFNIPTFDHITQLVNDNDFVISEKKAELEALTKRFEEHKDEMSEIEKSIIEKQIQTINLQLGFILPDDTMAFVCKWAMGNDISDIKRLNRDSLLKAATLAKQHNKAPSDYVSGIYTDHNKQDIDTYATHILQEYLKDQDTFKSAKHQWFMGGKAKALPKR